MGIGITLQVKEKYVGKKSIVDCTDNELKTILSKSSFGNCVSKETHA